MLVELLKQVAIKAESPVGTKATLAAENVIPAFNVKFKPTIKMVAHSDQAKGSQTQQPATPGLRSATISFDCEVMGGSAAAALPVYAVALRGCGSKQTIVASESVAYAPSSVSTDQLSVTVSALIDGKRYTIWGARGTKVLKAQVGEIAVYSFTFTGIDWDAVDGDLFTGVSWPAFTAPVFMGATLTLDGYQAIVTSIELDDGNEVVLRQDASSASGHRASLIKKRSPTLKLDPEEVLAATYDFFAKWKAGEQVAFSATWNAPAGTGKQITLTVPKVQYQDISPGERTGVTTNSLDCLCCGTTADDEHNILFA